MPIETKIGCNFYIKKPSTATHDSVKGLFFYETSQKIFNPLGGKIEFEFLPLRQCMLDCMANSNLICPPRRLKIFGFHRKISL